MSCEKDKIVVPVDRHLEDDDRAIRILKVEYQNKSHNIVFKPEYRYNEEGFLDSILMVDSNQTPNNTEWVAVSHENDQFNFISKLGETDYFWNKIQVQTFGNLIFKILVTTPMATEPHIVGTGEISPKREDNYRLKSMELTEKTSFAPICIKINSYNKYNLPEKTSSKSDFTFSLHQFEFSYQYAKGENIPSVLRRMINEELLYLNRYGITNYDEIVIANENGLIKSPFSPFGEGNWLISFGLPQYHILEDKSTHIVSKRTTKHYKINDAGEQEYVKTTVEDFPYIHDADAKTLEIAGLKIWYEFLDKE